MPLLVSSLSAQSTLMSTHPTPEAVNSRGHTAQVMGWLRPRSALSQMMPLAMARMTLTVAKEASYPGLRGCAGQVTLPDVLLPLLLAVVAGASLDASLKRVRAGADAASHEIVGGALGLGALDGRWCARSAHVTSQHGSVPVSMAPASNEKAAHSS